MKDIVIGVFIGSLLTFSIIKSSSYLKDNKRKKNKKDDDEEEESFLFDFERIKMSKAEIWKLRNEYFCPAQSVSYSNSEPLLIVKGEDQYLFDENGIKYLDTRNNVGHIGWQNKNMVGAVQRQLGKTNSNTRYLHPYPVLLAEKLLGTFPKKLCKVFFVNSGSEANDLALRLSQSFTNGTEFIVCDRAYHGHTTSVIDISPYKFLGKGGKGKPSDNVHVLSCPDPYRNPKSVNEYRKELESICNDINNEKSKKLCAFFLESGMSVAGCVIPENNYLKEMYAVIRRHGGVCVADEVQVGFGRFGDYFWGFQQQGVVPDIVTMGKPFGNGVPLAAVVCTKEISDAFTNGMEYFNTFGGNPMVCAAGLSVLETIERDQLQAKAKSTGNYLKSELKKLMDKNIKYIGDVRGSGLFIGIEFVRDKKLKTPATEELSIITTRLLREHKILTSCDGKYYNVLVLKPPLTFNKTDVDHFIRCLKIVIENLGDINISNIKLTPT